MNLEELHAHLSLMAWFIRNDHDTYIKQRTTLCRQIKDNLVMLHDIGQIIFNPDVSDLKIKILTDVLTDDMAISRNFRLKPEANQAVHCILLTAIDYHFGRPEILEVTQQALEKLIIVSPPQSEIKNFLDTFISMIVSNTSINKEINYFRHVQERLK